MKQIPSRILGLLERGFRVFRETRREISQKGFLAFYLQHAQKLYLAIGITAFLLCNSLLNASIDLFSQEKHNPIFLAFRLRPGFLPFYLLLAASIAALSALVHYRLKLRFADYNTGQKGTRRWLTAEEIRVQYKAIPLLSDGQFDGYGGLPVYREKDTLYLDDSATNTLLIGTTRSGKDQLIILPMIENLARAKQKASLVLLDPKQELCRASYDYLIQNGYRCYLFNMANYKASHHYNFLDYILKLYLDGDTATAERECAGMAESIYAGKDTNGDPYWSNNSKAGFTAMAMALLEDCAEEHPEKVNLYSVYMMFAEMVQVSRENNGKMETGLDRYFSSRPVGSRARANYVSVKISPGKTRASVFSHLLTFLNIFGQPDIAELTSDTNIDVESLGFGEQPSALFISVSITNKSSYTLASLLQYQIFARLTSKATAQNKSRLARRVVHILDELGNQPPIPSFDTMLTMGLGYGLVYLLAIQGTHQLKKTYKDDYETLMDNCGNKVFLLSDGDDTNRVFSAIVGSQTITSKSRSGNLFSMKNISEHYEERQLIRPDELSMLLPGEAIITRTSKRRDIQGNKVKAYPIAATGNHCLKFAYEYLQGFDTQADLPILDTTWQHDKGEAGLMQYVYLPQNYLSFDKEPAPKKSENNENRWETWQLSDVLDPQQASLINYYLENSYCIDGITIQEFFDGIQVLEEEGRLPLDKILAMKNMVLHALEVKQK